MPTMKHLFPPLRLGQAGARATFYDPSHRRAVEACSGFLRPGRRASWARGSWSKRPTPRSRWTLRALDDIGGLCRGSTCSRWMCRGRVDVAARGRADPGRYRLMIVPEVALLTGCTKTERCGRLSIPELRRSGLRCCTSSCTSSRWSWPSGQKSAFSQAQGSQLLDGGTRSISANCRRHPQRGLSIPPASRRWYWPPKPSPRFPDLVAIASKRCAAATRSRQLPGAPLLSSSCRPRCSPRPIGAVAVEISGDDSDHCAPEWP